MAIGKGSAAKSGGCKTVRVADRRRRRWGWNRPYVSKRRGLHHPSPLLCTGPQLQITHTSTTHTIHLANRT